MKKIKKRMGKDLHFIWDVNVNGGTVNLSSLELTVEMVDFFGSVITCPHTLSGTKTISWDFPASAQTHLGDYGITLWANYGQTGQTAVDMFNKFELVSSTDLEEPESDDLPLDYVTVDLGETAIAIGLKGRTGDEGKSIYDLMVEAGKFSGTEEEFVEQYENMISEGEDVADEVTVALGAIESQMATMNASQAQYTANETARASAESARVSAEAQRAQNSLTRQANETERVNGEKSRRASESNRERNEATRISNENVRVLNENGRENNEIIRKNQENTRISSESSRVSAEQSRVQAEGVRQQNESSRVSAETIRQQNDTAREGRIAALESAMPNKYQKPSSGIPKTDLSSDVQSSLGKADTALQSHQDISGKADKSELLGCVTSRMLVYYSGTSAAITTSSNVVGVFAYYGAESMDVDYSVFNGLVTITWNGVTPSSSCPIRIVLMEQTMPTEFIGGDDAWQYGDVVPNFSGSFGEASGYISTESGDVLCDNNNNVIGF